MLDVYFRIPGYGLFDPEYLGTWSDEKISRDCRYAKKFSHGVHVEYFAVPAGSVVKSFDDVEKFKL